jgi:hypothetical protein
MPAATVSPELLPHTLVDELARLSHDQVEKYFPGVQLLLVELRDDAPELAQGLDENQTWAGSPPKPSAVSAPTTVTFPALRAAGSRQNSEGEGLEGMDRIQLLAKLSGARHFVLPLFKRSTQPGEETRLVVGRIEGCDVMLRHPSISKQHAWFQVDRSGALYLTDAQSLNGTRVNGKSLPPGEPNWLQPLDHLQFGSVSAFTCAPFVLRSMLKSLRASSSRNEGLETP